MQDLVIANNKELEIESDQLLKEAELTAVYDKDSQDTATILLKANDELIKKIKETFDPICKKTDEAHKEAVAQRNRYLDPPTKIKKLLQSKIGGYLQQEREKAEAEARRKQEELRKQEEEKRLAEATKLEEDGKAEEAQAVLEQEIITPQVKAEVVEKSEGLRTRIVWKFRITDIDKIPRELMIPNEKLIGEKARTEKDKANIPGVEVYSETTAY